MAYQPKSYRKFIAGAAAAAVVAPVVAPVAGFAASFTDVETKYQEAVDFLVSKGIKGTTETTFGTQVNIKRVDAAVFVVAALGLDVDAAPASGFTDVPARAVKEVNALKDAGITTGKTDTTFASDQLITRGELAIWLQRAYDLEAGTEELAFTDVAARYTDAVSALVKAEITQGTSATTFGTEANAKRGDFALFIQRAAATVDVTPGTEASVKSVKSVDSTTLEVVLEGTVTEVSAEDFAFDGGLEVLDADIKVEAAAASDDTTTVVLKTSEQEAGKAYNLISYAGVELEAPIEVTAPEVTGPVAIAANGVKANTAKSLQVTFNKAVDTTKAVFAVKKGATTVGFSADVTWNADKTVAQLNLNSKVTEGTYDVTVTGLSEVALTGSVVAQNEKVTEIKLLSDSLVLANTSGDSATVGYQVFNQYGEDITKNATLAGSLNVNSTKGSAAADKGKVTINSLTNVKEGDKVVLTLIDPTSAVTANATLTVVAQAKASEVTIGDLYNKDGKVLSEDTLDQNF